MSISDIEKESLEAHVELCSIRYNALESRIVELNARMEKLDQNVETIKESLVAKTTGIDKQTINIFTSILGVILAGFIGFITHSIFK